MRRPIFQRSDEPELVELILVFVFFGLALIAALFGLL